MKRDSTPGAGSGADYQDLLEGGSDADFERLVTDLDALYASDKAPAGLASSVDRTLKQTSATKAPPRPRLAFQRPNWPALSVLTWRLSPVPAILAMCLVLGVFALLMSHLQAARQNPQPATPTAPVERPATPQPAPVVQVAATSTPTAQPTLAPTATATPFLGKVTPTPLPASWPKESSTVTAKVQTIAMSPIVTAATFLDATHGWIALGRAIRGTSDGGATWTDLGILPSAVSYLSFPSSDEGWAATNAVTYAPDGSVSAQTGALYTTQDGGKTWRKVALPGTTAAVLQVDFVDARNGWISRSTKAGGERFPDQILHTANGGQTWTLAASPCQKAEYVERFSFVSPSVGFVACAGPPANWSLQDKWLYQTSDGGNTWTIVHQTAQAQDSRTPDVLPVGGNLADLHFLDGSHGWMAVAAGGLYSTSNGGKTWTAISQSTFGGDVMSVGLVDFLSADVGYSVDGLGDLLETANGGKTWKTIVPGLFDLLAFGDPLHALGVGRLNEVFASGDGGHSWRRVSSFGAQSVSALDCLDAQRCWALASDASQSSRTSTLYVATDGGKTWQELTTFSDWSLSPDFLSFVNASTGFIGSSSGYLAETSDGGRTFAVVSPAAPSAPPVQALDFVSASDGWRIVAGEIQATHDGGKSWAVVPLGYDALAARLGSESTAWVIAAQHGTDPNQSLLLTTSDGGRTWTRIDLGQVVPERLLFADGKNVLLETLDGSLFVTSDSGTTWVQVR